MVRICNRVPQQYNVEEIRARAKDLTRSILSLQGPYTFTSNMYFRRWVKQPVYTHHKPVTNPPSTMTKQQN